MDNARYEYYKNNKDKFINDLTYIVDRDTGTIVNPVITDLQKDIIYETENLFITNRRNSGTSTALYFDMLYYLYFRENYKMIYFTRNVNMQQNLLNFLNLNKNTILDCNMTSNIRNRIETKTGSEISLLTNEMGFRGRSINKFYIDEIDLFNASEFEHIILSSLHCLHADSSIVATSSNSKCTNMDFLLKRFTHNRSYMNQYEYDIGKEIIDNSLNNCLSILLN